MYEFAHESLDAYRLALEVVRWLQAVQFPRGFAWLREQLMRSSGSVVLNVAEGRARTGDARRNHYRIAQGSAGETCAGLDILPLPEGAVNQDKLRRVAAMLSKLSR